MEFSAEHRFPGPPDAVAGVLLDRTFYETLELPDLRLDAVVGESPDAGPTERTLVLRYEYTGNLDAMALRLLGGDRLTWTQVVRLRQPGPERSGDAGRPAGAGAPDPVAGGLAFRAEARPDLLHGDAGFSLQAHGDATVRRLSGELVVALPIVGRMAEQRIVPGVLARLDVEAEAVRQRLAAELG